MVLLKYLVGLLTVLGLGTMLAMSAGADQIKSSTDSRGVIHITNNAPSQESIQTDQAPVAALPSFAHPRDKEDKLRILNERRGRLPASPWQEMQSIP
jgi:hypothetical protein